MFGKLLSSAIKIITLPVDAASIVLDIGTGGDGSKKSREQQPIIGDIEKIRDKISESAEEIDK